MRGHVAVHQTQQLAVLPTQLVGSVEALCGIGADARGELGRDAQPALLCAAHHLPERLAVEVLHGDPVSVVVLPEIEHLRDVGVVDASRDTRLVEEHVDELIVLDQMRVDPLDRDPLLEAAGAIHASEVNARHSAHPDLVDHAVTAQEVGPLLLLGLLRACVRR
ncbi:hypothetical protein BE15_35130 [Sorangium cellulosum]|uniref:Uncharacterized protein n=1 Tax=Sorangium cellulosum TaxID=56 RepID=A0A150QE84_SORCE|nr:hypothetical protein BE15_35130 [Sorangium cellulosum]